MCGRVYRETTLSHYLRYVFDYVELAKIIKLIIETGDIGYLPEQVETNMEKHFQLAHKWGCVLLLDEADVFLAKRNVSKTCLEKHQE
jgi:hypothetical protein